MLKYFDLHGLYEEMGEGDLADKLDEAIREDAELFSISENDYGTTAFFKEENEKSILKKYPKIKNVNIGSFEEYLEDYLSDKFEGFEIGALKIEDDVVHFIIETYKEMNFYIDDLWNSKDFDEQFEQINNRIVGELISITLDETLQELEQSDYEPNWETVLAHVPQTYKNMGITPVDTGVAKYIENIMYKKGYTKTWVANLCDINYKTFCDKLKRNSFDALELLKLGKVLEIDLNMLKDNVQRLTLPSKFSKDE